ncbi:hypothetical protein [Terribacillus saccharophilus]|uniref:hypothetical protein n=1 Tax=Terribacillus saccharophilus TaxID=361277 RepID=UPI002989B550|nr:hypothetical protein [Terribacillus saccharophilus]MCM3227539.1 hypothetical protein [Terribacillus saccharophilus]
MITCKYCGERLNFIGEDEDVIYFDCSFCELIFPLEDTCCDRKRKNSVPEHYESDYYVSIPELKNRNTISLFYMLRDLRSHWYSAKTLYDKLKKHAAETKLTDSEKEIAAKYKQEYTDLTKRKFIIENILLEKTGFLPDKLTDEFLSTIIEDGEAASNKKMLISL